MLVMRVGCVKRGLYQIPIEEEEEETIVVVVVEGGGGKK